MPVVKFPGVEKTFDEWTPEELEEAFNRVVSKLPHVSDEESARMDAELWEEFYDENAKEAITDFSIMLRDWANATKDTCGEDSQEFRDLQSQIEPVRQKLREFRHNMFHPQVKSAIKPLNAIWAEYRGWYYNEQGEREQRKKPLGPEVLSAFWRTASFDL